MKETAKYFEGDNTVDVGEIAAAGMKEKGIGLREEKAPQVAQS